MAARFSIFTIWASFIMLLVTGIMMVASTGLCAHVPNDESATTFLIKQSIFAVIGLGMALVISRINYQKLRPFVSIIWIGCVILLICCFIPGIGIRLNGESRWIGIHQFSFQPSEMAKIGIMVVLADWYTTHREISGTFFRGFVIPGLLFGIPLFLILIEKDMGTAAALGVAGACVMYVAGVRHWLLFTAVLICAVFMFDMATGSENRLERIYAWFDPQAFSQGVGRQQWIAMLAFARGGISGVGLGNGIEKFGNLPFAHTDFIFAEIGEEWGLVGTMAVLFCFTLLTIASIVMVQHTQETFGRLLAIGLASTIFWPAALNMAVVTSLLPNSGLPLPFISYGGTNLVFTIAAIGLLTSIQRHTCAVKKDDWPKQTS
ncbi:MAG: cell division protein FtsW [Akkermansiaceae bacterium]|nr:cell division protein FtsW [Akkermansiaceae bacterium]